MGLGEWVVLIARPSIERGSADVVALGDMRRPGGMIATLIHGYSHFCFVKRSETYFPMSSENLSPGTDSVRIAESARTG